jgi:hypothetical protein
MATQWTAGLTSGATLSANTLNTIGAAWETWTPSLTASITNPTLGTGSTAAGRYGRINKTVFGNCRLFFGSSGTSAGSGFYFVSLPITAQASGVLAGSGYVYDSSTGLVRQVSIALDTTSRISLYLDNATNYAVSSTNPFTWAASDQIQFIFEYEAA